MKNSNNFMSGFLLNALARPLVFSFLMVVFMAPYLNSSAQTPGDINKFTNIPRQPSCKYFDGFADNGNGTVTDPRNGLVWKRCAEGQTWTGKSCTGLYTPSISWFHAMASAKQNNYLGKSDWRLPSKEEAMSILGSEKDCRGVDYENGEYLFSDLLSRKLDIQGNPLWVWTYTPSTENKYDVAVVAFYNGQLNDSYGRDHTGGAVRLVRKPSGDELSMEAFNAEYEKHLNTINQYAQIDAQRTQKHEEKKKEVQENEERILKVRNGNLSAAKSCADVAIAFIPKTELGGDYNLVLSKDFQDVHFAPTNKVYAGIGKIIHSDKNTITVIQDDAFRKKQFIFQLRKTNKTTWFGDKTSNGTYLTFVGRYVDNKIISIRQGASTVDINSRVYDLICSSSK